MNFLRPTLNSEIKVLSIAELNAISKKLASDILKGIEDNKDLYSLELDFSNIFDIYENERVNTINLNKALIQIDSIYGMNNFIDVKEEEDIYRFLKISEIIYNF